MMTDVDNFQYVREHVRTVPDFPKKGIMFLDITTATKDAKSMQYMIDFLYETFKNEKIDNSIYETLIRRGTLISNKYKISKYLFFSLSGYTDWFDSLSDEDVLLLTLDSLYR